jgi:hypothetical protein
MSIQISVVNKSSAVSDQDVKKALPAFQKQVSRDFTPAWGIDAKLTFVEKGKKPQAGSWWLVILDNSDQAGALGYHDVTQDGLPLGKVFAGTDIQLGYKWTITFTHELLEMLADPEINLTVFRQPDANTGVLYAYEVCDPCEADEFGYDIDGVAVSDFVYPAWFEENRTSGTQFDHQKRINQAFGLLKGGYIGEFDVLSGTGWHQHTRKEDSYQYSMRARVGSRRERRRTPRNHWLRSNVL